MSDPSIVWLVRGIAAMGALMAIGGSALLIALGHVGYWNRVGGHFVAVLAVFFGGLSWVVIVRQPRNKAVWAMVAPALFFGWYLAGATTAALLVAPEVVGLLPPTPISGLSTTPADQATPLRALDGEAHLDDPVVVVVEVWGGGREACVAGEATGIEIDRCSEHRGRRGSEQQRRRPLTDP
jgi:hypothetical protein